MKSPTTDGYVAETFAGAQIAVRADALPAIRDALRHAGSLYAYAAAAADAIPLQGRGVAYAARFGAARWVVRHYRRGGALAPLLRDAYPRIGTARPLRELAVSVEARRLGVPTPAVIAVVIHPGFAFYRADIATEYVPASIDFGAVVQGGDALSTEDRAHAAAAAGRLVRAALDAGIVHRDLNLKNILLHRADGLWTAQLLDLDRADAVRTLSDAQRSRALRRLDRSWRKLTVGHAPEPALLEAFERGYAEGTP